MNQKIDYEVGDQVIPRPLNEVPNESLHRKNEGLINFSKGIKFIVQSIRGNIVRVSPPAKWLSGRKFGVANWYTYQWKRVYRSPNKI